MNGLAEPIYVGLPTRDGQGQIASLAELWMLGTYLKRTIHFLVGEAGNIPRSRNRVVEEARKHLPNAETAWILWVDSDIVLPPGAHRALGEAINWSEATQMAWAANYHMADGTNVTMKDRSITEAYHYTDAELAGLSEYAPIGMSGFGCCYLPINLNYVFHADVVGEDVHFFLDHPNLKIYYAKDINVKHKKLVAL